MSVPGQRTFFYKRISVNNADFRKAADIEIPFTAQRIIISNDSTTSDVAFSFDGSTLDGELFDKNAPIAFDGLEENRIHFKKIQGNPAAQVRVWAWRKHDV